MIRRGDIMKKTCRYLGHHILLNIFFIIFILFSAIASASKSSNQLKAHKVQDEIVIDGIASEKSWSLSSWQPLDKLIMGVQPTAEDFSGQFKVMWNEEQFILTC